jgi:hypothetical protein
MNPIVLWPCENAMLVQVSIRFSTDKMALDTDHADPRPTEGPCNLVRQRMPCNASPCGTSSARHSRHTQSRIDPYAAVTRPRKGCASVEVRTVPSRCYVNNRPPETTHPTLAILRRPSVRYSERMQAIPSVQKKALMPKTTVYIKEIT